MAGDAMLGIAGAYRKIAAAHQVLVNAESRQDYHQTRKPFYYHAPRAETPEKSCKQQVALLWFRKASSLHPTKS